MDSFNPAAVWVWIAEHKTPILAILPFLVVMFFVRAVNPR
jgi:hypothetical protein